ncbi:hypothetical protein GCM10007063_31870 [Lentibacillus kapialis]|uniref:Uncharacterized protein n=1 Tax=Lentibacillus kapialis TaxID=340214 RepID=A0A917V0X7_9BACI|nr:hypothetical protein GCM10007063_31870 [Lentibacillus kapialis]
MFVNGIGHLHAVTFLGALLLTDIYECYLLFKVIETLQSRQNFCLEHVLIFAPMFALSGTCFSSHASIHTLEKPGKVRPSPFFYLR